MSNPTPDLTEAQVIEKMRGWLLLYPTPQGGWSQSLLTDFYGTMARKFIAKLHSLGLIRSPSEIRVLEWAAMERVIDLLKNYGVSFTSEGILVPYSDEWDYLHDTPRRMLLRGNDKGKSAKEFFESELLEEQGK